MRLDEYKTQVLLLHSEQSTLDTLSSGFSDRYTVHCATSGSEALNTLVDTPINVIVTAQDLPGMSGLEALREARKRSPDTVGILLAGSKDDDLEALVGDEHVFQIVRGNVTSESILKLVENATQQIRLMALAESANDTAANVDEPATEHIIMETSENGSTIISDGTGRLPVLNPTKISAAASVGSQSVDVLVLTKDQEFLSTIKDSARGMHTVHYANTLAQANDTIRKYKVGVAVVDAAMVGDKVEQLTQHLRKGSARLVSIVAGRRDDGEMLMDLINRGKVYRFLLKPVSPGRARLAVESSVKHHLEAPDAAFKMKGDAAVAQPTPRSTPKPPPKPAAQAPAKPAAKATVEAKPDPKPQPDSKPEKPTAPPSPVSVDPPLGFPIDIDDASPIDDGLTGAFGGDDSSFTETVTGLFSTVTNKFAAKEKPDDSTTEESSPKPEPPPVSAGSGGSLLQNPKLLGIGAAAIVVVAGALFWLMSGSDDAATPIEQPLAETPSFTESDVVIDTTPVEPTGVDVEALIDEARLAREAGQIYNPTGSNAIELYEAAIDADPENAILAAELDAVLEQALGMAETALLDSRLDDANAALRRIAMTDPANARLPFLTAQLSQMQLRGHLADARNSIRETRFEDAANSLLAARALDVPDNAEIDAVASELSRARSEQRTDGVLADANARLEAGDLLSPPNDNARYYYELVLSNDPENTAARQGLSVVASKLALQARSEIDNGNLDSAQALLGDANSLDSANSEVAAAVSALSEKRDSIAEQLRQAEAQRIAQAKQRDADARAEAERQAAEKRAAEEAARLAAIAQAAEESAEPAVADTTIDKQSPTVDSKAGTGAVTFGISDNDEAAAGVEGPPADDGTVTPEMSADVASGAPAGDGTATQDQVAKAAADSNPAPKPASVSSLNRIKYVAPKYPRSAQRRNVSGWVDVIFTVAADGTVKDVAVRDSQPGDTFVDAAVSAVEKWEFEPVMENGRRVERRSGVRMSFAL